MRKMHSEGWWETDTFSPLDRALTSMHRVLVIEHPAIILVSSFCVYIAVSLFFGRALAVSTNYFVLFPVLAFSLVFGFPGGLAAGLLALPLNLTFFYLLGHPEFSPANKIIAEMSGIFVGVAFGYLSDYFRKMKREIDRRIVVETELRRSVEEKDILFRELHHRVKNNLNVIKGVIQLQRNRSEDPAFKEATGLLLSRVYAVSYAHETLFDKDRILSEVDGDTIVAEDYFRTIAENVAVVYPEVAIGVTVASDPPEIRLERKAALNLGIVVNELSVNAAKHAFSEETKHLLQILIKEGSDSWTLSVKDNGKGLPDQEMTDGLGRTIIDSVVASLKGKSVWVSDGGLLFELTIPKTST